MSIDVQCHNCSRAYRLKDEMEGKKFRCKECEAVVTATPVAAKKTAKPAPTQPAKPKAKPKPQASASAETAKASPQRKASASAKPQPAKKKPVKKKSPPPANDFDNFDDFGDLAEDDNGDFAGNDYGDYDYESDVPSKPKKKKSKKPTKKKSKASSSDGMLSNLPPMGFNFNRINAIMAIGGIIVIFMGIQEMRLTGKSNATPVEITLSELVTNGPGDNVYFTVSGVAPASDEYVAYETSSKRMSKVWVACQPADGGPVNFVLYTTKTPQHDDVVRLMSSGTHTGMIVNDITKLGSDTKKLLREGMPQINVDTAHIFQVDRKPSGFLKYGGLMLGGLVLMLAGLFWIFFVH